MNKLEIFLEGKYPKKSYLHALKKFLYKRNEVLSKPSVMHLFTSLHPINKAFDSLQINTLTPNMMKEYVETLWANYSSGTIRSVIGDMQQFGRWCKKKGLSKNFSRRLKKPGGRSRQAAKAPTALVVQQVLFYLRNQLDSVVARDESNQLVVIDPSQLNETRVRQIRNLFIVSFLYETGSRGGELAKLPVRAMREALEYPSVKYTITTGLGKTGDHDYFFTSTTAELWQLWDSIRDQSILYAVYGWKRGQEKRRMETNGISQTLVLLCKKAGVAKPFRCHALRHAKVKRARRVAGLDVAQILLDHANIETTRGYANIDDDELDQAVLQTGIRYDIWEKL